MSSKEKTKLTTPSKLKHIASALSCSGRIRRGRGSYFDQLSLQLGQGLTGSLWVDVIGEGGNG